MNIYTQDERWVKSDRCESSSATGTLAPCLPLPMSWKNFGGFEARQRPPGMPADSVSQVTWTTVIVR